MKVFVYGTLKKGYGNNVLLNGTEFLGEHLLPGFKLLNAGFPVASPSANDTIKGEVYELADNTPNLQWLDRLEANGRMYNRTKVSDETHGELELYVGHPEYWPIHKMEECPRDSQGRYYWSR